MNPVTYKGCGVDIDKASALVEKIKPLIKRTHSRQVLTEMKSFSALFDASILKKYKNPVLVSSTDGVGTKLKIAFLLNKHDTVGIDLVAMNANDILTSGARPLFFLDYLATAKIEKERYISLIKGITLGCKEAGCCLIAGETAEMPGMYAPGEYDLAGFCLGVVEKERIINGKNIEVGDKVIGLASSGLHSNGYSLVRKVFSKAEQRKLGREFLRPTRIYVKPVLSLLGHNLIKGIAHITGGGFYGKIPPILPGRKAVVVRRGSWPILKIFQLIQAKGKIAEKEMYRTFNMGIGMVLIIGKANAKKIIRKLGKLGLNSWVIGEVIKGNREVIIS